ncbi:hypothetical protein KIW84_055684 [Lathyrus oleraceus]|uniref:Retrovirus-related Pol polyprotein from transposon TNT 1-94-like beta-barrel domain-containing protein n=1 Tax=Pisum sativum TaxID=3888 RepID=A0A9D4WWB0_PEA|nr:hypothetical protein KIW84_055684 [Pisum sativum]
MSWLLNTMTNEIGENFMFYDTAKEIWDAVKETYSNVDNTSVIFEIKSILHDLRQGESSVTEYFNILNKHWQQLDIYEEVTWCCTEDQKKYKELVEKDRIYKFLLGLNKDLDEVRGRILGTKPLLKIREAFSEVRREESRKKIMLGTPSSVPYSESSAMAARGNQPRPPQKKTRPWCEHCKRPGHTKETCWIIHGKPSETKFFKGKEGRGNTAFNNQEAEVYSNSSLFSKEQMEALKKLLQQTMLTAEKGGTAVVAQRGNYLHALNTSKEKIKSWIVDSGASDHMTGDFTLFSSYSPCPYNYNVRIADGTHSKVMGKGSIIISPNITLDSVLYVPKLDCNLLSISKITRDLKCVTKFFPNLCEFQTLESGKTIGNAEECAGLYLLQVEKSEEKLKNNCHVAAAVSSDNNPGEHIENSEYQLLPLELTEHDKILPNQTANTQSAEPMPKPAEKLPDQTSYIQPSERTTEVVTETKPIIVSTTSQQDCDPKTSKWKGFCYKRKEVESSKAPMQGRESNQTLENEVPTTH